MSELSDSGARVGGVRTVALRALKYALVLGAAGALAALPSYVNDYRLFVINTIIVYCLVSVGFNIVVGYLGLLAFANAAFFGIGAYATGLLMAHFALPFAAALFAGTVAGALAGAALTLSALRLSGYYLVSVTWAFTELMRWIYVHGGTVTFGASGFSVPEASVAGFALNNETHKYYVFLAVAVCGIWACARMLSSRYGRSFIAIRNNEKAAAMAGIPVVRRKLVGFMWSGGMVGLAGGLYAVLNGRVTPESFGLDQTLLQFVIVMAGGLGSLAGSVLGAILITGLPEFLRNLPGVEEITLSLILIVFLFFLPGGLGGLASSYIPSLRQSLFREARRA